MKNVAVILVILFAMIISSYAGDSNNMKAPMPAILANALRVAKVKDKPIFMIVCDPDHRGTSEELNKSFKTSYGGLVDKNFILISVKSDTKGIEQNIPGYEFYGVWLVVVITPDRKIISSEKLYPDRKDTKSRIEEYINMWNDFKKNRDATNVVNKTSEN